MKFILFGEKEKGASRRLAAAERIIVFLSMDIVLNSLIFLLFCFIYPYYIINSVII